MNSRNLKRRLGRHSHKDPLGLSPAGAIPVGAGNSLADFQERIALSTAQVHRKPGSGELAGAAVSLNVEDLRVLADVAINLWRAKQRLTGGKAEDELTAEQRKVLRPLQNAMERLEKVGVTLEEHTGKPYAPGMAVNVISSQPNPNAVRDQICETLKPTVCFRGIFLQAGDVIVEGPTTT